MTVTLNRAAVANAVRVSPGFRAYTTGLAKRAELDGKKMARTKGLKRRTGQYEDGFRAVFRPSDSTEVLGKVLLENEAPYSVFLEAGTRAHDGNPLMVFFSYRKGHVIAVRHVEGITARWVVRDTLRQLARSKVTL